MFNILFLVCAACNVYSVLRKRDLIFQDESIFSGLCIPHTCHCVLESAISEIKELMSICELSECAQCSHTTIFAGSWHSEIIPISAFPVCAHFAFDKKRSF